MSKLFIVPTPIGNLKDITIRAIETLKTVELILDEDTRTSKFLCQQYDIQTPLQAYHKDNEHKAVENIVITLTEIIISSNVSSNITEFADIFFTIEYKPQNTKNSVTPIIFPIKKAT